MKKGFFVKVWEYSTEVSDWAPNGDGECSPRKFCEIPFATAFF